MENRLLVAFVLSLGVFIGWGYIMSLIEGPPPSQVELEKQLADIPSSVSPGISLQTSPIGKPGIPSKLTPETSPAATARKLEFPGEETTIKISTGLATYIFTNKGAMIKNILLTQHKQPKGNLSTLSNTKITAPSHWHSNPITTRLPISCKTPTTKPL